MSQFKKYVPSQEWPHWGRDTLDRGHALYTITAYLHRLDLGAWAGRCVAFLGLYDGLEQRLEETEDPLLNLRAILSTHVWSVPVGTRQTQTSTVRVQNALALQQRIVDDLLSLDFLSYRARISVDFTRRGREWNPMAQSWLDFIDSLNAGEGELQTWRSYNSGYIQSQIDASRAYLLAPMIDLALVPALMAHADSAA